MTITFPNGSQARSVHLAAIAPLRSPRRFAVSVDGAAIVAALGLPAPQAVLLISGGASGLSWDTEGRMGALLSEGVARVAAENGITVIDGGTSVGISQMMGNRLVACGSRGPLIGVCPAGLVSWPGGPVGDDRVPLDPNHTHFVLTPGDRWGTETETMFALASALSSGVPSLAILFDGGSISRSEVLHNIRQKRDIIAIQGSGRLADEIAAARDTADPEVNTELARIAAYPGLVLFDLAWPPTKLADLVHSRLSGEHSG